MSASKLPPIHPGEVLRLDFLEPLGMSQSYLARALNVPPRRINEIVLGKRAITADTARRLARYWGNSPEFWLNLQTRFDLETLEDQQGAKIDAEISPHQLVWGHPGH